MDPIKKRVVVKKTLKDGSKIKSVESRGGRKLVETFRGDGIKSRQVSKDGIIKKTVTKKDGTKHVEKERGTNRIVKTRSKI